MRAEEASVGGVSTLFTVHTAAASCVLRWCAVAAPVGATHPPPPPAAAPPPPADAALRKAIETLAAFVARNGPAFEALAMRRNAGDAAFRFLSGGEGAEYYRWRVQVRTCGL